MKTNMTLRTRFIALACAGFLAAALGLPAMADSPPIKINQTIPYAWDGVGTEEVRDCDWISFLVQQAVFSSKGHLQVVQGDLSKESGKVLALTISHVHSADGGLLSGPKWAQLEGDLSEGGKVLSHFSWTSKTVSTWRITTCGALDRMAKQLGVDLGKWSIRVASGLPPEPQPAEADKPADSGTAEPDQSSSNGPGNGVGDAVSAKNNGPAPAASEASARPEADKSPNRPDGVGSNTKPDAATAPSPN